MPLRTFSQWLEDRLIIIRGSYTCSLDVLAHNDNGVIPQLCALCGFDNAMRYDTEHGENVTSLTIFITTLTKNVATSTVPICAGKVLTEINEEQRVNSIQNHIHDYCLQHKITNNQTIIVIGFPRVQQYIAESSTEVDNTVKDIKISFAFGGKLMKGEYYIDVRTNNSALTFTSYHYINKPVTLNSPVRFAEIRTIVARVARELDKSYDDATHSLWIATGDKVGILNSRQVRNAYRCTAIPEDDVLLTAGKSYTIAIFPRIMPDEALSCVGGSHYSTTLENNNIINGLCHRTMHTRNMEYIQHLSFTSNSESQKRTLLLQLLKAAAVQVHDTLTADK